MKQFLKTKTIILAVIILIFAVGFLVWKFSSKKEDQEPSQSDTANIYEYRDEQSEQGEDSIHPVRESSSNGVKTYTNSKYNFSFQYPKGFTVANFQEGEYGETILVSKQGSKDGFQIFISPFDESGPLTKERILADVPDMVIENAEQRTLKNGAPGLIFFSQEPSLGKTREVWFIYPVRSSDSNGVNNGYLFQISTLAELDKWLAEILSTWRFQ